MAVGSWSLSVVKVRSRGESRRSLLNQPVPSLDPERTSTEAGAHVLELIQGHDAFLCWPGYWPVSMKTQWPNLNFQK